MVAIKGKVVKWRVSEDKIKSKNKGRRSKKGKALRKGNKLRRFGINWLFIWWGRLRVIFYIIISIYHSLHSRIMHETANNTNLSMNPPAGIVAAGDAYSERPIIEEPHLLRPFD